MVSKGLSFQNIILLRKATFPSKGLKLRHNKKKFDGPKEHFRDPIMAAFLVADNHILKGTLGCSLHLFACTAQTAYLLRSITLSYI